MKFKIDRDTIDTNTLYTIRGYLPSFMGTYYYRYIQFNYCEDPTIKTRAGYRASDVVCFESKTQARAFLKNFINSPRRRNNYYPYWSIVETAPNFSGGKFKEVMTSYGPCLKRTSYKV